MVDAALAGLQSVVNVGAGTGSYEPEDIDVIAVEPSGAMRAQRPRGAAKCLAGVAERLPLSDSAVDGAMAVNADMHWSDRRRGIAEMMRVSRRRVVIVTVDGELARRHWVIKEYLPEASELFAPLSAVTDALPGGASEIVPIPIPGDCADGSMLAFWKRPEAFLDPSLTRAMAALARLPQATVRAALSRLESDLHSGAWHRRHLELLALDALDLGQRLVAWDHPSPATGASSSPAGW